MRSVVVVAVLAACAPSVDGPEQRARTVDAEDGLQITRTIHDLPGVVAVHCELRRAVRDPFTNAESRASALVLVLVDDHADRRTITAIATSLVHAAIPDVKPEILIEVGRRTPTLARVGPFTVDARSKPVLVAVLVAALATIAALAGYIAWTRR